MVDEDRHIVLNTEKMMATPFLCFRWRTDSTWGFQCGCGNDSRLSRNEAGEFDKLVAGTPHGIQRVKESLKVKDELKFKMVAL